MTKGPISQAIWDKLPAERKARLEARMREVEIDYLTLHELRRVTDLTHVNVSQELGMPQSDVSRLGNGSDMLPSTPRSPLYPSSMP
jgi:hypothetical protein